MSSHTVDLKDVTDQVGFEMPDDEWLPLTKCVCGTSFPLWSESVGVYEDKAWKCPSCGVRLFFSHRVCVLAIND